MIEAFLSYFSGFCIKLDYSYLPVDHRILLRMAEPATTITRQHDNVFGPLGSAEIQEMLVLNIKLTYKNVKRSKNNKNSWSRCGDSCIASGKPCTFPYSF